MVAAMGVREFIVHSRHVKTLPLSEMFPLAD